MAAPAVLYALVQSSHRPTRAFSLVGWSTFAAMIGVVYPLYAILKSELMSGPGHVSLQYAVSWQLGARASSGFVLDSSSEAARIVHGWLSTDHLLPLGGLGAGLLCVAIRRARPIAVLFLAYVAMITRPGGYLPVMFVIVLLPFAALAVSVVLDATLNLVNRSSGQWRAVARTSFATAFIVAVAFVGTAWFPGLRLQTTTAVNQPTARQSNT